MNIKNQIETSIEIDLHNMTVNDAKRVLERTVMAAPATVKEVLVIHGYRRGTEMLNMVRQRFKCHRVDRKILTMNQGITILILK